MATSLAAQLAQIAAKSKTSLNVKAQKAAHSKSLIFEPEVAAGQSYQAVYTICYEGFEELCQLDARFGQFGSTLFAQESQDQDRTELTAAENAELDKRIESFLRLAGGRLRLMPAIKAIEWLIRRFRIHEDNTAVLLATFLPYHSLPVFVTLMSILPASIPQDYSFLHPYIRSLTSPPRGVIVHQATHRFTFLAAFSTYTLDSCRAQQHYPALISFWAGIMTEAVNGMLDRSRSGRKSIQMDNDQTVLQQLAPILGDSLVMKKVPGLQIASYMIVAVLASKGDLDDIALSAFMDQLVLGWTSESVRPGLVCLSILAQYRSAKQLSGKVTRALLKIEGLPQLLMEMGKEHRVDKLANGLALALIDRLSKKGDTRGLATIESIMLGQILPEKQVIVIFKSLLVAAHKLNEENDPEGRARRELGHILVRLSQASGESGEIFRKVIEDTSFDLDELELRLDTAIRPLKALEAPQEDVTMADAQNGTETREDVDSAVARLSKTAHSVPSCLSREADTLFEEVCQLFFSVASHEEALAKFDEAPLLHRTAAPSDYFYLTFYMRVWSGPYPVLARVKSLELAKSRLKQDDFSSVDMQAILPYCIAALGDPAKRVRRAAADLITVVHSQRPEKQPKGKAIWGSGKLYQKSDDLKWLTPEAARSLLDTILLPALEEAMLHEDHISAVIKSSLESSSKSSDAESTKKAHISHAARLSILTFLSSHVLNTPILRLKLALLKALNQVRAVSGTSRTQLLLPLLRWWAGLGPEEALELAQHESLSESELDSAFVEVVVPTDKDGIDCLFQIIAQSSERSGLIRAVFSRIRKMWPAMKDETKFVTAQRMLDISQKQTPASGQTLVSDEAADLLRNVELTTHILLDFLNSLQDAAKMATEPPANKRRRTSSSEQHRGAAVQNSPELNAVLRKVTFVLQLVESSNPAEHPQLLQSLFMTLSDLQLLRTVMGSELGYLQQLVLSSLLAMMPAYKKDKALKIDTSVGHGDVLVTCIQKSSSPAVQNSALLLVASLAQTAPDVVLHSVMPIFTFMGSSVLKQSDDYSAHVINQTIKEVVPPLIETFRKSRRNIVASASELLSSFVIAYEHVPSHRKHDLFISLTENLGPRDFLFALVAMFVDRYGTSDDILSFCAELMNSFGAEIQLQTLVKFLDLVRDMFKPKPTLSSAIFAKIDSEEEVNKTALKQLTLLPYLLANRTLKNSIGELAERDDMEASKIRELYAQLLEDILTMADTVKARKSLHAKCGDALANLLNLLSIGEFIKSVETLLDRPNIGLRQKVLRALEVRVDKESNTDIKSRTALLSFLPQLTAVIRDSDDIHYKHTAVSCVDKISEKYGKKDIEAVAAAASTIAGDRCLGQDDKRLRIMALLCLASLVDVLQDGIVPVLPSAIPSALGYLKLSVQGERPDRELHNASYAFITSLAQYLPYMISGSSLDQLLAVSNLSAQAPLDSESNENRRQCLQFLAKRLDGKVLFTALHSNWRNAAEAGFSAIGEYIEILGTSIDKHNKSAVAKNVDSLSAIFLGILDLRRQEVSKGNTSGQSLARLTELETSANDVALKMIYKLNDAAFRPVFSQMMDWSSALPKKDTVGLTARQYSVYGLLYTFFDGLKSIVTSYATYVVDSAAKILKESNIKVAEEKELWKRVLQTLTRCFEHDQDDFWQTPSHFGAIAPVLAEQFLHAPALDVSEDLVPAVVELAAAADSQDHQKELNGAILKHLRSEQAAVRLAAVKCEQSLTDRLGEEWLSMLPEMLPYISELQDDDDEVVERETHRWIVKIEGVLGESLDSMLQ
ncbi:U3 small nucleolar RNA-associated protein 10 [Pleurostoma richardsiae]|uniref:U3 small nucleolar RNA-associated protein 10 n=1 Tax=Pleurostoma richardsiae TaxID=41990 RepID=A0AA38VBC3_9PEZI|nr:U3 small nucleolar RNA-associated protein 10 [Pleurostoma richardsiae]